MFKLDRIIVNLKKKLTHFNLGYNLLNKEKLPTRKLRLYKPGLTLKDHNDFWESRQDLMSL